mmetsp:Transcript_271/g.498  ORF Transcript_271/g.498 Transcript_271/m.498 type:complete len:179 (-) Transcript_271:7-543(-)
MSTSYTLRYNAECTNYLKKIKYHELVHWLTADVLVEVAKARKDHNLKRLEELQDPSGHLRDVIMARLNQRGEEGDTPLSSEDLEKLVEAKNRAYQSSADNKWTRRPASAHPSLTGDRGSGERARTAPANLVGEIRSLRAQTAEYKSKSEDAAIMVQSLEEKLKVLKETHEKKKKEASS